MCSTLICRLKKQKYLNTDTLFEKKRDVTEISAFSPFMFTYWGQARTCCRGRVQLRRAQRTLAAGHTGSALCPAHVHVDIKGPVSRKCGGFTKTIGESGTLLYLSGVNCDPQV
jgi:hypothetical protein